MVRTKPARMATPTAVGGALFLMFIILGLPAGLLGVAWPGMRDTFGLTNEAVGALLGMSTAGHIVASFLSGRAVTRWGIYPVLVGSTLLSGIVMATVTFTPTWFLLVVVYSLWGISGGLIDSSANVFVARYYNARIMNWMHASFGLGATLGPLLVGGVVAQGFTWRAAYGVIGLLVIVLLVVLFALRPVWPRRVRPPVAVATATDEEAPDMGLWASLRVPAVWLGMAIFFVYGGVEITAGQWSFTLFTEGRGAEAEIAGLWVTAYWGVFTFGRVFVGFIANRIGAMRVLDLAMGGALLGMIFFWFNLTPLSSYLGLALLGFALAPIFPTLITLTPDYVGRDHATNATGFQVGITGLGVALLPSLAGVLAERVSLEAIGPFLFMQGLAMTALYLYLRWGFLLTKKASLT